MFTPVESLAKLMVNLFKFPGASRNRCIYFKATSNWYNRVPVDTAKRTSRFTLFNPHLLERKLGYGTAYIL